MSADEPITRLLTLLNVSATKVGKRKRVDEFVPSEKLNRKRKSITFAEPESVPKEKDDQPSVGLVEDKETNNNDGDDDIEDEGV